MIYPKGRKHCRSLLPDFISNLPDTVIDVILMCLPCKDAVRTCILSKKWMYNWSRLTELTLDGSLWKTTKDLLYPTVKFTKIIYQLLTVLEGPITKFTLDLGWIKSFPEIDNFLYFLFRNGIQHLYLRFPSDKLHHLPSSLFTCLQLRDLSLQFCLIHPPSAFQGFDRLISLELCYITVSSELLGSLISHCPLLEQLVLRISETVNIIEINAPMLRSFDFTGDLSCICLKNVPLLAEASLVGDGDMVAGDLDFAKVFESCSALEHLLLDLFNAEFYADVAPTRLRFDLNSVECFFLRDIMLESYRLSCALRLIKSLPSLEYLEIKIYSEANEYGAELLELEHFSDVTFNYLKEVKLDCFTGATSEMQLIKLLLAKSPVLVRMRINPWLHNKPPDSKVLSVLSKYLHATPEAEVVFISHDLWLKYFGSKIE